MNGVKIKMKPVIVLIVITTAVAALLVFAANTFVVDPNELTPEYIKSCEYVLGSGSFSVAKWEDTPFAAAEQPSTVTSVIKNTDADAYALEIVSSGYSKDGLTLLIGAQSSDSGTVTGKIAVVELKETPGLGTKVNDKSFLETYQGFYEDVILVKREADRSKNEVQGITGATRSSEGVTRAVNTAIDVFKRSA